MAGGKRYKFSGSEIALSIAFTGNTVISGISKAKPAMVTAADHGYVEGAVVKITDVGGMTEINDRLFVVGDVTDDTFQLIDVDSTKYGAFAGPGGSVQVAQMSNFCELTGYNRSGGSSPEIDATTICSEASEFEVGLPDFGTTQFDYNFAPRTAIQMAVEQAYRNQDPVAIRVKLPRNGGEMVQLGFVQQTSESASNGGLWTGSMTVRNTGQRIDIAI